MDPFVVSLSILNDLCDRAIRHRCRLAIAAGATADDLRSIRHSVPFRDLRTASTGWVMITLIMDECAGADFHLCWHRETDRLRTHRIGAYEPPLPGDPPLRRRRVGTPDLLRDLPFIADPGYVFTHDGGVDHDAAASEFLTKAQGSLEGWTWRRR